MCVTFIIIRYDKSSLFTHSVNVRQYLYRDVKIAVLLVLACYHLSNRSNVLDVECTLNGVVHNCRKVHQVKEEKAKDADSCQRHEDHRVNRCIAPHHLKWMVPREQVDGKPSQDASHNRGNDPKNTQCEVQAVIDIKR